MKGFASLLRVLPEPLHRAAGALVQERNDVAGGGPVDASHPDRSAWTVAGTGDFNQDNRPDLLWHHRDSGQVALWYMQGGTLTGGTFTSPSSVPDVRWRPVGVADFNRDRYPDIVWHHEESGQIVLWSMADATLVTGTFTTPSAVADTNWRIVAVEDYNADLKPDLVWRHALSGQNAVWLMDGANMMGGTFTTPSSFADVNWRIVGPR